MLTVWALTIAAFCHVAFAANPGVSPEALEMLRSSGQDELFAKLLGIEDVSLVRATEERSEGPLYSNVSPLGDILLTKEQAKAAEEDRQGVNFHRWPNSRWIDNEIPYWITPGDYTDDQRTLIENSLINLSNRLTNLKLRPYKFCDKDYLVFFSGQGCWSYLGRVGGQQPISLQANGCVWSGIVQHEVMHAAGFGHEHSRPDRDNYVNVLFENIPPAWHPQYQKANYGDFGLQGEYDYYSLMHYPMRAPGTNLPAFEIKNQNISKVFIGQRWGPTYTDIEKIDNLYTPEINIVSEQK